MTFNDNPDEPTAEASVDPADTAPAEPATEEATTEEVAAESATADADATADVAGSAETSPVVDKETGEILSPEVVDAEALIEEQAPPVESPADRPGKWFVVHTQSGYEKKVKQNLEARTQSMNMEGRIHEVVIPMEDVVEFKNGKK